MRNQLLRDTDWASMAHSLEVRVPLVDVKLLSRFGLDHREGSDRNPSVCSRTVRACRFPEGRSNVLRPGFATPIQTWLQRDNRIQQWRRVPALAADKCAWARRWAFQVSAA